jgi:SOS-response transcriptional repressor LexA
MFKKLSDNLNLLMSEANISADELGRRTGIPSSTIKKIRNRYNPNPTLTTLQPLAQYFVVTLSQLVGDEPIPETRIKGAYQLSIEQLHQLPLISWEEAIHWPSTINQTHSTIATENGYSSNAYALIVEDENWENLVRGTALLVDPKLEAEHRDFIIVHKLGQKTPALKQALFDDGQIYLKPVTDEYQTSILTQVHKILGIVVEYKKNLKRI